MTRFSLRELVSCLTTFALSPTCLTAAAHPQTTAPEGWQSCQTVDATPSAQLKCFQDWAATQTSPTNAITTVPTTINPSSTSTTTSTTVLPVLNGEGSSNKPMGCRDDNYSALSRFWELQRGTDCGTFSLRGYRPTTIAWVTSDSVNMQPTSTAAGHTAPTVLPYSQHELKIQLSIRTKIAKGLFTHGSSADENLDSLWFGYTQQSYWQFFNSGLSRPFRNTDHEPEIVYIYPHQIPLVNGWSYRLSGLGVAHQSNGQSLPLSRSWNRVYLVGAAEKTLSPHSSLNLQGKIWQRLKESSGNDDNPGIENYVGRAEATGNWRINPTDSLSLILRHSLTQPGRGSARLDWMVAPSSTPRYTGLRYHLQFFSGYGDSLIDYNRRRSVFSVGLSLVDW